MDRPNVEETAINVAGKGPGSQEVEVGESGFAACEREA